MFLFMISTFLQILRYYGNLKKKLYIIVIKNFTFYICRNFNFVFRKFVGMYNLYSHFLYKFSYSYFHSLYEFVFEQFVELCV